MRGNNYTYFWDWLPRICLLFIPCLERLKLDVIEAGFAARASGDFEAVQAIANAIKDSTICSLSRAQRPRHLAGGRSAQGCQQRAHPHLHCHGALHMEKKLRMTPDQVVEQAVRAIGWAKEYAPTTSSFLPRTWHLANLKLDRSAACDLDELPRYQDGWYIQCGT